MVRGILVGVLLVSMSFTVGCSEKPPKDEVVLGLIIEYANKHSELFSQACPGVMDSIKDFTVTGGRVLWYEEYNEREKCFPVRLELFAKGECGERNFGGKWISHGSKDFNQVFELELYQSRKNSPTEEYEWKIRYLNKR